MILKVLNGLHDPTNPALFNKGRLITLATSGVETDTFTWDLLGRATSVSKNITGAQTYNIGYGYNLAGEVSSVTYPSNRVVTQTYDAIGRSSQISDGTPRTYANQFSYNPAQQLLGFTAGNSVQGIFGYSDPRLQIGSLSYKKGVNTLFSLSYGYAQANGGNNNQITAVADNITAANSLMFTYDAMGRLTRGQTANTTSPNTWDITWGYDRYGNRMSQTETAGTLADTNSNLTFNSNNQITGGFAYDASGNMTNDGITTNYVYDAENRFVKLGSTVANTYDGSGLRIEKVTGGSTTVYIFSGAEVIAEYTPSAATTAPTMEYIYSGSRLLATLDASHNPTYRQSDHLSARLFTDASGNVIGTQGHLPFGEGWYLTGTVDKWKFTSYERDSDTNLDYAIMRFDSARLARFMSPDPLGSSAGAANPQSWNRYAYVLNNPVTLGDPLGMGCPANYQGPCPPDRQPGAPEPDDPSFADNIDASISQPIWTILLPLGDYYVHLPRLRAANNGTPKQTKQQCIDNFLKTGYGPAGNFMAKTMVPSFSAVSIFTNTWSWAKGEGATLLAKGALSAGPMAYGKILTTTGTNMAAYPGTAAAGADIAETGAFWTTTGATAGEALLFVGVEGSVFATTADLYARWTCRNVP